MSSSSPQRDDPLDRLLADVPVPDGLRARWADDAVADAAVERMLRDVSIPFGFRHRLRAVAATPHWRSRSLAAAAALFLIACVWQGVAHLSKLVSGTHPRRPPLVVSVPRIESLDEPSIEFVPEVGRPIERTANAGRIDIRAGLEQARQALISETWRPVRRRFGPDPLLLFAATGARAAYADVRGAAPGFDASDVVRARGTAPRGIDVALGAAERKFLLDRGAFPFVSPREFPTSSVPPSFDTASFESVRAALARGEWPEAGAVRVEEFLAAGDYRFARPQAEAAVRLSATGAIAPWSPTSTASQPVPPERTTRLLQLEVQARDLPAAPRKPVYLTVAVDVTAGMKNGGRLTSVKSALRALLARLGGADRVTLTTIGGDEAVLIADAGRAELDQLLAAVDWLDAGRVGSLSSGAAAAVTAAAQRQPPRNVDRRLVLVSDAFDEFDPVGARTVSRLLMTSAARGIQVFPIDLGRSEEGTAWDELARRTGGKSFRVATTERLRSALMEVLSGRSQLTAAGAVLTVSFHPQAVAGYRLFGYEPTPLADAAPQPIEIDLHAGQGVTVLYEVALTGDKNAAVGTAVLRWRDVVDGSPRESVLSLTRAMLGSTFEKSSANLQMATIAAAAAGRLRNSPWGDNVAPQETLQWLRRLDRARTGRSLDDWIALLEQMQRKPAKPVGGRGPR